MTIEAAGVVLALVVALFGVAVTYRNWAALRTKRLDQGLDHLAKFERATLRLIKDESTPEAVVDLLGRLSREVGKSRLASWTVGEILSGKLLESPKPPATDRARILRKELDQLTDAQTQLLAESIAHALMASASAHPLFASYLRRALSFAFFAPNTDRVDDGDKARAVIVDYGIRRAPVARLEAVAA